MPCDALNSARTFRSTLSSSWWARSRPFGSSAARPPSRTPSTWARSGVSLWPLSSGRVTFARLTGAHLRRVQRDHHLRHEPLPVGRDGLGGVHVHQVPLAHRVFAPDPNRPPAQGVPPLALLGRPPCLSLARPPCLSLARRDQGRWEALSACEASSACPPPLLSAWGGVCV